MSNIETENLVGMTAAEQRVQIMLRMDRLYEAQFAGQIQRDVTADAVAAANEVVKKMADELLALGASGIAAAVLEVIE